MTKNDSVTLTKSGSIAVITFDSLNQKVNVLNYPVLEKFSEIIYQVANDDEISAAIITSGKKDNFIAGADLHQVAEVKSSLQAESVCRIAQNIFGQIAQSKKPYIAAIHGSCMGGGLELALACHYRIGTLEIKTVFAFPEMKLGLLPAGGGTQRLPRLIGLKPALDMLLTGRTIDAKKAHQVRILDEVVNAHEELFMGALRYANKVVLNRMPKTMKALSLWSLVILYMAKKKVIKKTSGHYPAPLAIIEAIQHGIIHGFDAGLIKEAKLFGKLSQTDVSKNLIWLFFAQKERQKNPYETHAKDMDEVGIVGSGLMGSGIAYASLLGDLEVHLNDKEHKALSRAEAFLAKELDKAVQRKKISELKQKRLASKLHVTTNFTSFERCDVVVEAIFEELQIKQTLLQSIEPHLKPTCIFASNTSSVPIADIAKNSAIKDRIIGMHYFSPANKIPLLEIVRSQYTSEQTLAKAIQLGLKQKKTIIVVHDSVGFYTTRIIAALLDESCILLVEGVSVATIDKQLKSIGFPMGPLTLMDEVGLDIGLHISQILYEHFGKRLISADLSLSEQMVKNNFLGRKSGRGFYVYHDHCQEMNAEFNKVLASIREKTPRQHVDQNHIGHRLLLRMVNEAAFCFSEKVIDTTEDGDVGAVFGLGFPPYLGGPFHYIENQGKAKISGILDQFQLKWGERFTKAPYFKV